jgi:hypothetical protein
VQLEIAGKMLRAQANSEASVATMIEAAQQTANGLDILASSLGSRLDVSV